MNKITLHFVQPATSPYFPAGWSPLASIDVLKFLRHTDGQYDIIHFAENSGIGYFSLLAKHEGIALQDTRIVVGLHGAQIEWASMMNKHYPTDSFDFQLGIMERRSAEMADVVVSPSEYMIEYVTKRGWQLPRDSFVIPNIVRSSASISTTTTVSPVPPHTLPPLITELVFFGRLEERKGTRLFIEALELLLVVNSTYDIHSTINMITFLGKDALDTTTGIDSSTLITQALLHLQTESAHLFNFQFLQDYEREDAINYLKNQSRLAVLPALADNSPSTVLECISNSIRFLASTSGGIAELVNEADHKMVLFEPRASSFAAKLAAAISSDQVAEIRATEKTIAAAGDWIELHEWISSTAASTSTPPVAPVPTPLVSICIVHHDRPGFLVQLLSSLRRQAYTTFEVILIDDGSTSPESLNLFDQLQQNHTDQPDWIIIRANNSYLGEARNRAASLAKGEYLLFLDDDDILKPHALQTLVNVAVKTGVAALSSWLDEFSSDEDPTFLDLIPHRRTFWFTGQSIALGILENCFGSGNIFVNRLAFQAIGGFSTFREVGAEDWEFYMKLATHGYTQLVVPEELIFVRSASSRMSMVRSSSPCVRSRETKDTSICQQKFTMDEWDSSYRALLPLLNDPRVQELEIAPSILFGKAAITRLGKRPAFADSQLDFETIQGWNGWSYSFARVNGSSKIDPLGTLAEASGGQWDMALPGSKTYIMNSAQHPYVSKKGDAFAAIRTFTSPRAIDITLRLDYTAKHQSGDGTELKLVFKKTPQSVEEVLVTRMTMDRSHDVFQRDLSLVVGSTLSIISAPLTNDEGDYVEVGLVLTATKASTAWSTLARKAHAVTVAQALRDAPELEIKNDNETWTMYKPETFDPDTSFSIALIFDENRLSYAQQVMRSAEHFITSRPIRFHLVCPTTLHEDLFASFVNSSVTLHIYDNALCDQVSRDVRPFSNPDIHISAHCKFFLADIITDVERVLYLDTDSSILSDISECYSYPTSPSALISMGIDMGDTCQLTPSRCWPIGLHWRVPAGLKCGNIDDDRPIWDNHPESCSEEGELETIQLNGGVALLELGRMRDEDFVQQYIEAVVQTYKIVGAVSPWGEQDFINSYFRLHPDQLEILPCGCNYQWFGSRREVKCGKQPLYIAHSWSVYSSLLRHRGY
jgi:GT2 family glycosyltransferase/lipopolysaccharide biosynthesis glycosyltransferase/glycosyltransferase involved in cell wall biosynthesis